MKAEQPKLIKRTVCFYFLLFLAIQCIHSILDLPGYDLIYILMITFAFSIGELSSRYREFWLTCGFFLMDLWPDWILVLIAILSFVVRNIKPIPSLNLKIYRKNGSKITAKIGI